MEFPIKVLVVIVLAVVGLLVFVALMISLSGESHSLLDGLVGLFSRLIPGGAPGDGATTSGGGSPAAIPGLGGG